MPPNAIATYPSFTFDATPLEAQPAEQALDFRLYEGNSGTAVSKIAIQTAAAISIILKMGKVPIDATECYVKYTFPDDFVLPAEPLQY
jgi:hypothetical protein